jgi:hypothetical protein
MLAISQSGITYYYMNWVPAESGPLVTHHGSIQKDLENPDRIDEHYFGILDELFTSVHNEDPICTFSLDSSSVLFSTCYADNNSEEMINWHLNQTHDEELNKVIDYYHFAMSTESGKMLNIGFPKGIRQSFQTNMSLLKSKLNGLSVGIFSAEVGARQWMHADKNGSYLIWKIGKKKNDELLFIQNSELVSYFSIHRSGKKSKVNWQFGNSEAAELICQDIINVQNNTSKIFTAAQQVYLYTTDGNMNDVKFFHSLELENLTLLNPLSVLETTEDEKVHEYNTLSLAETGNSFGGIDV